MVNVLKSSKCKCNKDRQHTDCAHPSKDNIMIQIKMQTIGSTHQKVQETFVGHWAMDLTV
jgi:hypothetical protein